MLRLGNGHLKMPPHLQNDHLTQHNFPQPPHAP